MTKRGMRRPQTSRLAKVPRPPDPDASNAARLQIYIKLSLAALFWGAAFPAMRIVSQAFPDMYFIPSAGRCGIACILLLIVARKLEGGLPRLNRSQFLATFALGTTGFFLNLICLYAALSYIPGGRAALIVTLNPVVVALALAIFFRERLGSIKWLGIGVALIGAAVIITRGDLLNAMHDMSTSLGMGELLMFGTVFCWTVYSIIGRHALKGLSPIATISYSAMWGFLLLAIGSGFEWQAFSMSQITWQVIVSTVYIGAFSTVVAFVWYYEGLIAIGPSRASIFNNLVPVFGVALSAVMLDEPVLLSMIIGGAIVVAGVTLTNRG